MFKLEIIGNVVTDPTFRKVTIKATGEEAEVANFRIAANVGENTYYVNCSAWRGLAGVCKYVSKGRKLYLSGVPKASHGISKTNGNIYDNLLLSINTLEFLGARPKTDEQADPKPEETPAPVQKPAEADDMPMIFTEDDMPF